MMSIKSELRSEKVIVIECSVPVANELFKGMIRRIAQMEQEEEDPALIQDAYQIKRAIGKTIGSVGLDA